MSPHGGAPFQRAVETAARRAIDKHLTPGLAVAVVEDGSIRYEAGFGASGPAGRPVTPSTRFAIGSLTKQFTAAAVLLSVRSGGVKLDDPLATYSPAFPNSRLITVRELLNQTSGLHNYPNLREHPWPVAGSIAPSAIVALLASDPSDFKPGTQFAYSNANYAALAEVVAKSNGTSYGSFVSAHLFMPLGMSDSGYGFAAEHPADAVPTESDGTSWIDGKDRIGLDLFYGAGGIVSTVHDLARWNRALLGGAFIDRPTQALLWEPGRLSDGSPVDYAMGFVPTAMNLHREVWHNGYAPNAGGYCYSALFPDDHLGVVVLTNSGNPGIEAVSQTIVRTVLESYFPPSTVEDDAAASARIRAFLEQVRSGNLDRSELTPGFSKFLSFFLLLATRPYFRTIGDPASLLLQEKSVHGKAVLYRYRGTFSDGSVHEVRLAMDGDKISGFQVPP
jgi:D-alanyl-D-alanine carboxypeptidase